MNRLLYGICVMFVAVGIGGALTVRGQSATRAINNTNGVAVQGYDMVAYFTQNAAVKGSPGFSYEWKGVRWQFASAQNRDAFAKEPARYAPAFGGYCAYGVSRGYAVDIDPEAFAIESGTLYLNYSKSVQRTWNTDRAGYIDKARQQWPKVLAELN
jgi:YHS domain-containing protein